MPNYSTSTLIDGAWQENTWTADDPEHAAEQAADAYRTGNLTTVDLEFFFPMGGDTVYVYRDAEGRAINVRTWV